VATFNKLKAGHWRVQVRCKGRYVSETFARREEPLARRRQRPVAGRNPRADLPSGIDWRPPGRHAGRRAHTL